MVRSANQRMIAERSTTLARSRFNLTQARNSRTGNGTSQPISRRGLTLAELLIASTILALIAGTLATIATAVQQGNRYAFDRGLALQHGRAVADRIERTVRSAYANASFPGMIVVSEAIDSWSFPDTLVVWRPTGTPAQPSGLPRFSELVIYSVHPREPGRLMEWTAPTDNRTVPSISDAASWQAEIANLKANPVSPSVELTDLLRVGKVTRNGAPDSRRPCLRFDITRSPSDAALAEYQSGNRTWASLPWPQDLYGSDFGLRQSMCLLELQLRPGPNGGHDAPSAVPFIAPWTLSYPMSRP